MADEPHGGETQTVEAADIGPVPAAAIEPAETEREAKAAAQRAALEAHGAELAALVAKLDAVKAGLDASAAKAAAEPGHLGYAQAFVRHGHLLADEWLAWIKRTV